MRSPQEEFAQDLELFASSHARALWLSCYLVERVKLPSLPLGEYDVLALEEASRLLKHFAVGKNTVFPPVPNASASATAVSPDRDCLECRGTGHGPELLSANGAPQMKVCCQHCNGTGIEWRA